MKRGVRALMPYGMGLAAVLAMVLLDNVRMEAVERPLASPFVLKELGGNDVKLKDYRGKYVVLVFGELYQQNTLKALQDLKKVLAARPSYVKSTEVLVIVSEGARREEYRKVREQLDIRYPVLFDVERSVYGNYEIIALPTTFIIGPDGSVICKLPSYTIAYYDQVDAELGHALGEINKEELENVLHPVYAPAALPERKERYLSLAENLRKRGSVDSALNAYQEVLKEDPSSREAHLGLGMIYIRKSEADKAEAQFQFVLRQNPDDPAARKGMAEVYLLRGNVDGAEDLLKKLTASGYVDEDIFFVMGGLYEKKGDIKEAMYYYKKHGQRSMPEVR